MMKQKQVWAWNSVTFFSSPVTSHKKQPVVSFICVRGRDREEFENVCSVGFGEFSISDSVIICGAESGMAWVHKLGNLTLAKPRFSYWIRNCKKKEAEREERLGFSLCFFFFFMFWKKKKIFWLSLYFLYLLWSSEIFAVMGWFSCSFIYRQACGHSGHVPFMANKIPAHPNS